MECPLKLEATEPTGAVMEPHETMYTSDNKDDVVNKDDEGSVSESARIDHLRRSFLFDSQNHQG